VCDGERILKIGQHIPKLWARVGCSVFDSRVDDVTITTETRNKKQKYMARLNGMEVDRA